MPMRVKILENIHQNIQLGGKPWKIIKILYVNLNVSWKHTKITSNQ